MSAQNEFPMGWDQAHDTIYIALFYILEEMKPKVRKRAIKRLFEVMTAADATSPHRLCRAAACIKLALPRLCEANGWKMPGAD